MKNQLLFFLIFLTTPVFAQEKPDSLVFSEAVEMAQAMLDSMEMDAIILGGETFYGMGNGDGEGKEEDDYKEEDRLFFGDMNRGPSIVMGEHEGDSTGENSAMGRMVPDGYAYMWNVLAYDSSVDSVVIMYVDAEGVFDGYMLGTDEADEEIDFSIMKPLPESYIDSDSAMVIASEMGGDRFLDYYSSKEGREYSEWEVDLYAIHEYWALPDVIAADVPVMWVARYFGISKDMEGWTEMAEYSVYMDMTTGDTLFTEWYYPEEEPYEPQGIVFSEAVEMAQAMLDSMEMDAIILGGETFYGMGNGDGEGKEEDDYKEEDRLFFGDMNRGPSIVMGEHEGDSTGENSAMGRMVPDGYAYMWNVLAYDSSVDSVVIMYVDAEGVFDGYMLGTDEADEEIDFSIMKPLPESYIDSDSAMVIASEMGGDRFLDYYSSKEGREYSEWEVDLYAIHEYWALPDVIAADVPVMWVARYFGISKDMEGWTEMAEYSVYMDMTTGDTLFTEWYYPEEEPYEPQGIVFSEAVEMAQAMLDSMEMDAIILGGETFYGMGNGDGEGKEEDDYKEEDRLFFGDMNRGPSIVMGEHEGDSTGENSAMGRMVPDGYAYMWNVLAYDSSVDSVVIMYVDAEGVFDGYMLGTDEADEEIDFSIMKPLPESYIDSDSAMVIASEMGGDRFLDYYSSKEGREYSEWEVDLYAIHEYWALPDVIAADVPVMWVARYFGISKDMEGWTEMAEYSVYMDMTTGDTLFTEWYYPEEEPYEPQGIVFSEAVEMAQAMLDSMEMDAIILGGETFYGMGNGDGEGKEEDDYKEEDRLFFGDMNRGPSIVMGEHEGDSTGENSAMGRMVPDGYAYMWNVLAYDSSVDSVVIMYVDAEGVFDGYMLGTDEADEEIDFSIMKPLPESYIDSDSAMVIASEMGGDRFLDYYSSKEGREYSEWEVDLYAIHEYWALPDVIAADVPVMWVARYFGISKDMEGWTEMAEYSVYMDMTTGDTLFTEWYYPEEEPYEPQGIVFSEAVEMAQAMLDSMEMDAIILGGETFYGMGNGDGEGKEEDDYKEEDRLFFGDMNRGPSIVMGEHEGDSTGENSAMGRMVPDGYAYMWNVLAYDSSVDSVVIMYVDAEGVFDGYMLGTDEADEEIDFSIMKPLPESYIDSDSAMVIASEMGGDRFLDYYSSKEGREYSEWEVDLYAIHEYWALPDVIAADVPVMWVARYFGISKDMEGWTEMAEYSVYMDMTTGDTLFTEWYYPEEEPYEPQGIVFSEAVEMAQAMLDSMEMDAIILGGETFYGMGNGDGEGKEEDDYKEEDRLFFGDMNRGPSIVMGEHEGDSTGENSAMGRMVPDGYAYMWNVLAYDSSVDSVVIMYVDAEGVFDGYMLGTDEADEEIDFSIMKPLPQVYMDSNELFETIFQQATFNGEDIVNMILPEIPSGSNLTMDMEVRILHDYWGLPVDLAPELIPVTWHMNMYATAMDSMGYVVMEDSLSMFMDAGTGELLYASKELTNIEEEFNLPLVTTLHQNYPNPFNPTTSISFELNKAQNVSLIVYNLLGQRVLTLVNDRLESGKHRINLNASNLASGIYMYRLTTNSQSLTKKMTLIK